VTRIAHLRGDPHTLRRRVRNRNRIDVSAERDEIHHETVLCAVRWRRRPLAVRR
jgi:hypothetical protein